MDHAQLENIVRAAYAQGYAQGREDAARAVGDACAALPRTPIVVERLLVSAALGPSGGA